MTATGGERRLSLSAEYILTLSQDSESSTTFDLSPVEGSVLVFSTGRGNTSRDRGGMSFCDRGISTRGRVFVVIRIIFKSVLIAIKPITLLTDVGSCMANLLASSSCLFA